MDIPIQNIYYLLCYSWDKLDESEIVDVSGIDSPELIDLFAKVLSGGLALLLKRGLDRYYVVQDEVVPGIKGKLNLTGTVKGNLLWQRKTRCAFDEFSFDILHNRILRTTVEKLLRASALDESIRDELRRHFVKFPRVSSLTLRNAHFKNVRLHRNNSHYDFFMKICRILYENLFIDESTGSYRFRDFLRDERAMGRLFEGFVRNFYRRETGFKVGSEEIRWSFVSSDAESGAMLPRMLTDISLKSSKRKIIIDTKFYKEAFGTYHEKLRLNSSNLYQLFAYLNNQEETGNDLTESCEGILLYPSVYKDFEYSYQYKKHRIRVMSINLNQDWKQIHKDLLQIVRS